MPAAAHAHFYLETPTNWVTSNTVDGTPEKTGPCGNEGATLADGGRSAPSGAVSSFSPNADGTTTVTVTIHEVVPHAGWYRVALVPGRAAVQTRTALPDPTTPATSCAATIANTPTLPVVADNLLRHTAAFASAQTVQVTLPASAVCTQASPCTLQIIEVMNDGAHFPPGCFYHHCADISIARDAGAQGQTDAGDSDSSVSAGDAAQTSDAQDGTVSSSSSSSSSGAGAASSGGLSSSGSSSSAAGSSGVATSSSSGGTSSGSSEGDGSLGGGGRNPDGDASGAVHDTTGAGSGGGCLISPGERAPTAIGLVGLVAFAALARWRRRR